MFFSVLFFKISLVQPLLLFGPSTYLRMYLDFALGLPSAEIENEEKIGRNELQGISDFICFNRSLW